MLSSNDKDAGITQLLEQLQGKREKQTAIKQEGGWQNWIKGILIGLAIFIGIGVVKWMLDKRNRELAQLKTKQEQDALALKNKVHEAAQENRLLERTILLRSIETERKAQILSEAQLRNDLQDADLRAKKLQEVKNWNDLNKA
jgi:hypothetical protein